MKDLVQTAESLIDAASTAIISSIDSDGFPNTKAMLSPRKREGIVHLYFTTNTSSMRVAQYSENAKACVYFFDNKRFKGLMLTGTMQVLLDDESKKMIWIDGDEMYYAKGVTDPDYCVLKFTAKNARFYSKFSSQNFVIETKLSSV